MANFKIVNAQGNEATTRQVFGYKAYTEMVKALNEVLNTESLTINGNTFQLDEGAKEKILGMLSHIENRWDAPIKPVKIVEKTTELEW